VPLCLCGKKEKRSFVGILQGLSRTVPFFLAVHPRAEAGTKGARVLAFSAAGGRFCSTVYRGVGPRRTFKAVVSPGNTSTRVTKGSKPSFLNWSS